MSFCEDSMQFLDLPENLLFLIVKTYLRAQDWCTLAMVCSRLRDTMQICWLEKRHLILDKDILSLNPNAQLKFHIAQDNLWPQRLCKTDSVDVEVVKENYRELWFLLKKCTRLQRITFCSDCIGVEKRTMGKSVLRLFTQRSFYMVNVLNLSYTTFSLTDLEETAPGFSNISELRIENCRIYINRNLVWKEQNQKMLHQYVVDYPKIKKRMCQGVKVFLIACSQIFGELQWVYTGNAEFQSTGCIVYSFGREEYETVYKMAECTPKLWDRINCCF